MTIKSFTKLSLSALLLAAATHSAIAEDPAEPTVVTLSGGEGQSMSWSAFVNALNNPASITGSVDAKVAKKLEDAKTELTNANTNKTAKDDAVTAANQALTQAKKDADAAVTKVNETRDAYNNANNLVSSLNEQINSKKSEYDVAKAKLDAAEKVTDKVTPDWLQDSYDNAVVFERDYEDNNTSSTAKIWYFLSTGRTKTLSISFLDPTTSTTETWTQVSQSEFYDNIVNSSSVSVSSLQIYLGAKYSSVSPYLSVTSYPSGSKDVILKQSLAALQSLIDSERYGEYKNQAERDGYQTTMNSCLTDIENYNKQKTDLTTPDPDNNNKTGLDKLKDAYDVALADQTAADRAVTEATTALSTAKEDATAADTRLRNAQSDLTAAQAAYDAAAKEADANALLPYKDVTLTGDVTANVAITTTFDGRIEGNGHVITLDGPSYLFRTLAGQVVDIAVNGQIFSGTQTGVSLNRVASWANNSGTYYDANGTVTSNIKTIGELGFIARDKFGADVATNTLTTLTNETKVYNITVYKTSTNAPQAYVNLKNGTFTNGRDLGITANTFVKSATSDFGNIANVFYTDEEGANVCANVQIKDQNGLNFYCPVDITATAMTFDRTFKGNKGMNAVCLPFDLDPTDHESIDALCKYDVETADKFWFKKIEGTIPANTPFLLYSTENSADFSLGEFHDITIKQTPAEQIVMYEGDAEDPSKSFGTLKKTGLQEFLGNYQAFKVYALKDNKFQATKGEAAFPAFRMIVTSEIVKSTGEQAPRRIAIVDEKGVEITDDIITGVENVAEETSSLNIAGGQGEIVITSDADYGKVEVYTMAGGVAAVADVMAGTTSVSLQKGIYIVMGKKVMVK